MNKALQTRGLLAISLLMAATPNLMAVDCDAYANPTCSISASSPTFYNVGCCEHTFSPYDFRCAEVTKHRVSCSSGNPDLPDPIIWHYHLDWYPNPSSCSTPGCV